MLLKDCKRGEIVKQAEKDPVRKFIEIGHIIDLFLDGNDKVLVTVKFSTREYGVNLRPDELSLLDESDT